MAIFKFVSWIVSWLSDTESFDFEWDKGNIEKNKTKHGVDVEEVEEAFTQRLAFPLGKQIYPKFDEERFAIVGPTKKGRFLHIVFTIRENRVRPISARPAHKKEKEHYGKKILQTLGRV